MEGAAARPVLRTRPRSVHPQQRAARRRPRRARLAPRVRSRLVLSQRDVSGADRAEHLNSLAGYYINSDNYLDYDLLRMHRQVEGGSGSHASKIKQIQIEQQQKTHSALQVAKGQMEAAGVAMAEANEGAMHMGAVVGRNLRAAEGKQTQAAKLRATTRRHCRQGLRWNAARQCAMQKFRVEGCGFIAGAEFFAFLLDFVGFWGGLF